MGRFELLLGALVTASLTTGALAKGGPIPNGPPVFTSHTPSPVVVRLDLGQRNFEITGTAVDFDVNDIVHFTAGFAPEFMQFQSFDGNPGSFRLHADNLTGAQAGGYLFDVIAIDNHQPPAGSSLRYFISIVPEPTFCALFIGLLPALRRCRKFES